MKKKFTVFISLNLFSLFVFLSLSGAHAQSNWQWQNPVPQGNNLISTQMVDNNTIVAVGIWGTFVKSTDAGATWQVQHYLGGLTGELQSVYFTSTMLGYIVDVQGNVYTTTDGGQNWSLSTLKTGLNKVYFNGSVGFIVADSGRAYRTGKGGAWQPLDSFTNGRLVDIQFTGADTGFILEEQGSVFMSTDAGNTWQLLTIAPQNFKNRYRAFRPFSPHSMAITGKPSLIYITSDSGANWNPPVIYYPEDFQDIYYLDADTIIAAGGYNNEQYGDIFRSTDSGKTFTAIARPNFWVKSISFINKQDGIIVGLGGEILLTHDAGITWQGNPDFNAGFSAVDINSTKAVAVATPSVNGFNFCVLSNNQGKTWSRGPDITNFSLYDVTFIKGSDTAITVGAWGNIWRSTDAGATWTQIHTPLLDTSIYYYGVSFPSRDTGFIVGASGTILKTTDGGLNWNKLNSGTTNNFTNVLFINSQKGFATEAIYPVLFTTSNGGQTWDSTFVLKNESGGLNSLYFISADTGFVVGADFLNGMIARTTDGGANWTKLPAITFKMLTDISFAGDTGVVVGQVGEIIQTNDRGASWHEIQSPVSQNNLAGVKLYAGNGTIVGQNTILHHENGVLTYVQQVPSATNEWLSEVYPNPVMDKGQFTLAVPVNSKVKVSLFNILGKEVQMLADKTLQQGTYTFEWTPAKSLSPGVYFIHLETNDVQRDTKKVVLIR